MICLFCQQPCVKDGAWWECFSCHVDYNYTNEQSIPRHIKFEVVINFWACALNLYPQDNKTVLTAFHLGYGLEGDSATSDPGYTKIYLNHCMTGVTPQNCMDKIKMMLVFQ